MHSPGLTIAQFLYLQTRRRRKRLAAKAALAAPTAPSSLQGADNGVNITLSWQDLSANETQFRVYRKVNAGSFALYVTPGQNAVQYVDVAVSPGNSYAYYVTAFNTNGESDPTNTVTILFGS
jgi:fibronectin type 3 domain-containing protein